MNTTPIPNRFFDRYLPRLTDSEIRILLVVLRGTLGWIDDNGSRKRRDWISHRQFQKRSGRRGEAVSRAIESLVRQGLIDAQSEKGRFLNTARSRKSEFGKVFYSPGPLLLESDNFPTPTAGVGEPKPTKASKNKRKLNNKDSKNDSGKLTTSTSRKGGWTKASAIVQLPEGGA